jgi:hypothetical protein
MWALLIERLKTAGPLRQCENCGRMISGKGGRRFCSRKENLECHRERGRLRREKHKRGKKVECED